MNEQNLQLYETLSEYRDYLKDIDAPEHILSVIDNVLQNLTNEEPVDSDELEVIASYIEEFDVDNPEFDAILDTIRDFEEGAE